MISFNQKVFQHITNEGLIFYSKYKDLYSPIDMSYNEITLLFDILSSKEYELSKNPNARNFYAVCLYYLAEQDPKYVKMFYNNFVPGKNIIINNKRTSDLYLIYNIIEFEDKYHIYNEEERKHLGILLMQFNMLEKQFELFLLYDYYCSLLHLYSNQLEQSIQSSFLIIQNIGELSETKQEVSDFTKFIELKNSVLNTRISQLSKENDVNELATIYSNLLSNMKNINRKISLKLGLKLFDLYREKNKYTESLTVIKGAYKLLQCELLKGNKVEFCTEYMLNICTKMAYASVLLNDRNSLSVALKKLQKYLELMAKTQNEELLNEYGTYLLFYQQRLEYTGSNNKNYSLLNFFRQKYKKLIETPEDAIVNLFAMNSSDQVVGQFNKIVETNKSQLENKIVVSQKMIVPVLLSIFNYISNLTKSIKNDPNEAKQKNYIKEMSSYSMIVLNYIDQYHNNYEIIQLNYIKESIYKISFTNICTFYLKNNYQEVLNNSALFEKKIGQYWTDNPEEFIPFSYILKIKGDAYLKLGSYREAKSCYLKCELLRKGNEKHLAIIRANLGICYLLLKDKKKGMEYLNLSLDGYNNLYRLDNNISYQEKYRIVNNIISKFGV